MSDQELRKLAKFVKEIMAFVRLINMESGRLLKKFEDKK